MNLPRITILFFSLLLITKSGTAQQCFTCGEGTMGDFHAFRDTTLIGGNYEFLTFKIEKGIKVRITGNNPLIIKCKGDVTIEGILSASGENGQNGNNSGGGSGGIGSGGGGNGGNGSYSGNLPLNGNSGTGNGQGGFGVTAGGGGGGGYATVGFKSSGKGGTSYGSNTIHNLLAGSGGGGGSGANSKGAGGGGAGGGYVAIYSCEKIEITKTGALLCIGGNGGNDNSGNCGGGGGGSGGAIWMAARIVNVDGIVSAAGGYGGSSSMLSSSIIGNGGNGAPGRIRVDYHYGNSSGIIYPTTGYTDTPFISHIFRSLDTKCYGSSSGYAKVRSNGGKYPTKFLWSNGSTLAEIKNISAGNYTVTVTDANGCSQKQSIKINEPSVITPILTTTSPSCTGYSDGYMYTSANGGYSYPATRNITTSTRFSNESSAGIMLDIAIGKPITINSFSMSFNSIDTVHLNIWYKLGSYHNYENNSAAWTNIGTFAVKSEGIHESTQINLPVSVQLGEGTYSFYIVNEDGEIDCITSKALGSKLIFDHVVSMYSGIGRDKNLSPFSAAIKPMLFFTGLINYTIPSANGLAYEYLWKNSIPSNEIYSLSSGDYKLKITDAIGCEQNIIATVPEPDPILLNKLTEKLPTCPGDSNGFIDVLATGGNFNRTLTSSFNCDEKTKGIMFSININSPIILNYLNLLLADTSSIWIWIKRGGFAGFEQSSGAWTSLGNKQLSPANAEIPVKLPLNGQALSTGIWSIYLYSPGGKIKTISSHNPVNTLVSSTQINLLKGENIIVNGNPFNSISGGLMFFGGSIDYSIPSLNFSYQWNDGTISTSKQNLKSDNYTITITDNSGCKQETKIFLDEPSPIQVNAVTTDAVDSMANGSASVTAIGGTPPYYYFWLNTQNSGPLMYNVPAGNYPILTVDAHGCVAYDNITISRILSPVPETGVLVILPNPSSNFIKLGKEITGMDVCRMQLFNSVGQLIFNKETSISTLMSDGLNLEHLSDGIYTISVADQDQFYSTKLMVVR